MLSYWNQDRLVVRGRIDGGHSIDTDRKTSSTIHAHNSIVSGSVNSREEGKFLRVKGNSVGIVRDFLNDEM